MELKIEANGDESKFIQQIVDVVQSNLSPKMLDVDRYLVGMSAKMRYINWWIQDDPANVSIMVIYGTGGVGKTTIAKTVYNENYRDFDGCSFLSDIRERSKDLKGIIGLQKKLLSDICKSKCQKLYSDNEGIDKIRDAIGGKRVLVLDDVDHVDQLNAIFRVQDSLFGRSKIIVTTRNRQLKHVYQHCEVHEVLPLSDDDSTELFCFHAFRQGHQKESYMEHIEKIVSRCGELPLALKVLGASLYAKKEDIWESLLKKLDRYPNSHIIEKLKISFDCLQDDDVKNVFLHISCFLVGEDQNHTVEILHACEMSAVHGIDHLVDLCLLKIDYDNKLRMHQLIKDMGRFIIYKESPNEPGKRSRLWHSHDCFNVLKEKSGPRVKVLAFDMQIGRGCNPSEPLICKPNAKKRHLEEQYGWVNSLKRHASNFLSWDFMGNNTRDSNEIELDADGFARMQKLMFLKLNNVEFSGCYTDFPEGLRWLSWRRCHFKCIPSELSLRSLVCLDMQYSSLKQLWKGSKFLPALKILNLSHSLMLATSPDFSGMINLERLILKGCTQLVEVCESIKFAEGLVLLNLKDCKKLRKLPRNISTLIFLETLIISGCSRLVEFPMGLRNLNSLKVFRADRIDMKALLSPAKGIPCKASFPQFIEELSLENCQLSNDYFPKDLSNLSLLKKLNLKGNLITSLPDCRTLSKLEKLWLDKCPLLRSVVGLPITFKNLLGGGYTGADKISTNEWCSWEYISCIDCPKLAEIEGCYKEVPIRNVDRGMIKNLGLIKLEPTLTELDMFNDVKVKHEYGTISMFVPMDKLPECFISFKNIEPGDRISFAMPNNHNKIQGLTLGFVFPEGRDYYFLSLTIYNMTRDLKWIYGFRDRSDVGMIDKGVAWLHYAKLETSLVQPGDQVDVEFDYFCGDKLEEFGVMFVYNEEEDFDDDNLTDPTFPQLCDFHIAGKLHQLGILNFGSWKSEP